MSRVTHLFGGQYLWLEGTWSASAAADSDSSENGADGSELARLAAHFAAAEAAQRLEWQRETQRLRGSGRIALWGAGAKGVTFANLVDPDGELIDCVVNVNPKKQGMFLPGSGHPIIAPERLTEFGIATALVLNSNYVEEIRQTVHQLDSAVSVLDLMDTMNV